MGFITALARTEFRNEVSKLLTKRIKMLSSLANQYDELIEQIDSLQVSAAVVDHTLFVKRIMEVDDDFAQKEEEFFAALLKEQKKTLKKVEMIEELDMAVAECKNKLNLAISVVRKDATTLYKPAIAAGVKGVALTRLEYLKELTLEKELDIFDEIINEG